ncbi:sterile alpha motif domain-containing protein 12-like isoform X2 [Ambystoma mexicanum]|uniref:sterile alpha motif domain-containing protein 12-like isoform X2 n=1 Tax=Ambystoma mexicanum TaxID=8296 RepID=UPI0037E9AFC7
METQSQDSRGSKQPKISVWQKPICEWTVEDVCRWLKSTAFAGSALMVDMATIHAVSGRALLRLTDGKLEKMGIVGKSQRQELMEQVLQLRLQREMEDLLQITEA